MSPISIETVVSIAVACYISWGIGANDETMAMAAGGTSWSIDRIVIFGAIFAFVGAVLFGQIVEKTIGTELLLVEVTYQIALLIVGATALWLTVASWFGWPVSTTHTAVGAIIGFGIMAGGLETINWEGFSGVFWGWALSPLIGLLIAFVVCLAARFLTGGALAERVIPERGWVYLSLSAGLLTEFWRGANDVGNATAFLSVTFADPLLPRVISGVGMAVGLIILGRKVIYTVGTQITRLPPSATFFTQVATVVTIAVGTLMGLPMSGTHILVGSILGAGLAVRSEINRRVVAYVILAWFVTFPAGALFTMLITHTLSYFGLFAF
ncbi:MAG: inorganic phosphate transporter [Candidatus Bathyarchaeia archaeon]